MAWYDDGKRMTIVREYKGREAFDRDAAQASPYGWEVVTVTESTQRSGCLRILLLWWFTLIFRPKAHLVVTYRRSLAPPAAP